MFAGSSGFEPEIKVLETLVIAISLRAFNFLRFFGYLAVDPVGLEPTISSMPLKRSSQLSHGPVRDILSG